MYLEILRTNLNNNYITSDDYQILKKCYRCLSTSNREKNTLITLSRVIKSGYDALFEQCNLDLQIYQVEDFTIYPRDFSQENILILENLECLMQTKSLTTEQYFILKKLFNT